MRAHLLTIVCKFGSDRAIFGVVVAIPAKKFTDGQTDRQTDKRQTPRHRISSFHWNELKTKEDDEEVFGCCSACLITVRKLTLIPVHRTQKE